MTQRKGAAYSLDGLKPPCSAGLVMPNLASADEGSDLLCGGSNAGACSQGSRFLPSVGMTFVRWGQAPAQCGSVLNAENSGTAKFCASACCQPGRPNTERNLLRHPGASRASRTRSAHSCRAIRTGL